MNIIINYLNNLWDLYVDMSFYIVIGLLFTGALHVFVKKDAVLKHVGKDTAASVVKASVVGVPLPLCSCGVVPTALYLGKNGASKGAVVSFLTSTPQTGVDSIIATYGLMGPLFAIYRAIAAFVSGIIGGIATNIFCSNVKSNYDHKEDSCGCSSEAETSDCCAATEVNSCSSNDTSCGCSGEPQPARLSFFAKIKGLFSYAFGDFLDDITVNFIIGLLIAALISTVVPQSWLASFSNPLLAMPLMLLIGIPMYICSTASIPIALSLIIKGISPGAAFVFLFAGPITNIASLAILAKTLGKKVLAVYITSACACAIAFGLILDFIINITGYKGIEKIIEESHEHEMPLYMFIVAIIFGLLLIKGLLKRFNLLPTTFHFKHRNQQ